VPKVNHVIEFASMRAENGEVVEEYEQLFHAEEIPPHVEVITRIRTLDIQDKPTFEQKREEVQKHLPPGTLLVGQNLSFDIGMLKGEGIDVSEYPWIDTSMLASLVFPELESYSLGYLSTVLNLNHAPQHRALGDVRATLELLGKAWERLLELPAEQLEQARSIAMKSSPGYRMLFAALPEATKKEIPRWLHAHVPAQKNVLPPTQSVELKKPTKGEVALLEEPLEPSHLHDVLRTAVADRETVHWIAVKNLDATVRRLPDDLRNADVRILYPPNLLLDQTVADAFVKQDVFTADEATLAIKLLWYRPRIREDFPLHGGEEAVWNGRIACTEVSATYSDQFKNLPAVLLLDHRQLLGIVNTPDHAAYSILDTKAHVLIDDASMLEDTATKAFGWYCSMDDLRAAAEGNPLLTKITDVAQLWIEKVRQGQDLRYLGPSDLALPETRGLQELLEDILRSDLPSQTKRQLESLDQIFEPENLNNRLAWIEVRPSGSQTLQSVPERIGTFLADSLYRRIPTTLLIPAFSAEMLPEILPSGASPTLGAPPSIDPLPLALAQSGQTVDMLLNDLPAGKSIILLSSKGIVETLYVKHMEALEARGITMICQGMSGGQGRMQAEFLAASAPAVWLITPWVFEGIDLPANSVDHLFIRTLPFDHPSHPVFSRRSHRYKDGFHEYCVPRLLHRIFRLLRTFSRFKTPEGDVHIQDERIFTKEYGKTVRAYVNHFAEKTVNEGERSKKKEENKNEATKKKPESGQMAMF
jgi:DNA polymerase III epsilon subunit-like protein